MIYPPSLYPQNKTVPFLSQKEKVDYDKTKKFMPKEWIWHNRDITYSFNEYGHRSAPFKSIDPSKTIAVVGCSHIMGSGNRNEDTIPSNISSMYGIPTYNIGQGGGDNQIILHNAIWAVQQGFYKVIVCWTEVLRHFMYGNDYNSKIFQVSHIETDEYKKYFTPDYMLDNPHLELRLDLFRETLRGFSNVHMFDYFLQNTEDTTRLWKDNIWKTFDSDVCNNISGCINNITTTNKLWARDLVPTANGASVAHYGPYVNREIAKDICERIKGA